MWSFGISNLRTLSTLTPSTHHPQSWCFASHKKFYESNVSYIKATSLSISLSTFRPSLIPFFASFLWFLHSTGILMTSMNAREDKLYLLSSRYLFTIKVYHVVPISRKTDKVFKLELFVWYFWIVFLVNAHTSGIHDAPRFHENNLGFMRDVSFRYPGLFDQFC